MTPEEMAADHARRKAELDAAAAMVAAMREQVAEFNADQALNRELTQIDFRRQQDEFEARRLRELRRPRNQPR